MPENDLNILKWLLSTKLESEPGAFESVVHWKRHHARVLLSWSEPVDMAIAGGFLATCPAYAFGVGYWAALHRLLPDLPKDRVPALCISEEHGPHPAKIACRLEQTRIGWQLNGKKHFVTCGREADQLLVAASTGKDADGKNRLRLVRVDSAQNGIITEPLEKPLAMIPEISHCAVVFSDVAVPAKNVLPGDGYRCYIKPFRTIEDLHVTAAIIGYLLRIATRFCWPPPVREQLLPLAVAVRPLARADYGAPETHLAAEGVLKALKALITATQDCWQSAPADIRQTWQRDCALLDMAAAPRAKRLAAARRTLF